MKLHSECPNTWLAGHVSDLVFSRSGSEPLMYFDWTDWFFFAQDDWKVTPNFTLNLGLRYELPGNPIESLYPVNDRIIAAKRETTRGSGTTRFRRGTRTPWDLARWGATDPAGSFTTGGTMDGGTEGIHNLRVEISGVWSNDLSFAVLNCRP